MADFDPVPQRNAFFAGLKFALWTIFVGMATWGMVILIVRVLARVWQ